MREITETIEVTVAVKQYIGTETVAVIDDETGDVQQHVPGGDVHTVTCPPGMRLVVGDQEEIAVEVAVAVEAKASRLQPAGGPVAVPGEKVGE